VTILDVTHPDQIVVDALRRGDERSFRDLVHAHHASMVRVAAGFVPSHAVAEEVVQDTWLAVIKGISSFEGRYGSSLKTWIFTILVNQARTRGERERRITPMSSLLGGTDVDGDRDGDESTVDPDRFLPNDHRWGGHWSSPPRRFDPTAGEIEDDELRRVIESAVAVLPASQQRVVWLRDVQGWTSVEVCDALNLSEANQRVLLHRGRAKVRAALEQHLDGLRTSDHHGSETAA
jgi:RNA polymerase sigma-70 factor, ECF subfamily